MNKKRLFAIVLFIVLGLFMFTFANPRNNKDNKKANGDILTPVEQTKQEVDVETASEETTTTVITTPVVNNNQTNKTTQIPTVDLTKNKQAAIDELNNYKKDYNYTDDTEYKKIIDEYVDKINNSDSKDGINKNLEDGKEKVDELIKKDLQEYKEKAKEEVQKHAEELELKDIEVILNNINQDIDNGTTKDLIDEAKERGIKVLDDLLEAAKENAIKELEEYKKNYPFNEKNKKIREEIVEKGSKNINDATTISKVLEELKKAKKEIKKLAKKDLLEFKEEAKKKLKEAKGDYVFNDDNVAKYEELIKDYSNLIDNAKNNKKVLENLNKGISEIKTLIAKDQLEVAKENAIKELEEYKKNYPFNKKNKKAREEIVEKGSKNINDATTISKVQKELKKAKNEIKKLAKKDLLEFKEEAKKKLKEAKGDYVFNDDNVAKYEELIKDYSNLIDNAKNNKKVLKNLNNGISKIKELMETDLSEYKENAIEKVKKYANSLNFTGSSIKDELEKINTKINEQTTKKAIDEVVENACEILKAKKDARIELERYMRDYPFSDESEKQRAVIARNGKEAITKASDETEIANELKAAKELIDDLVNKDLQAYKDAKKNEIDEYKNDVVYADKNKTKVSEIKDTAKKAIADVKLTKENRKTIKDEIDKIVKGAKDLIDAIPNLENTLFTVKFLDKMGKVLKDEKVKYNTSAEAPVEVPNVVYKGVTYKFEKWDTDYSNITDDLTVKAEYTITEATVKIFVLKDGVEIPENGRGLAGSNYEQLGTSTLKLTDEIIAAAFGDKNQTIISLDDSEIRSLINKELPLYVEGKDGYVYKCYVLKLAEEAFHVDVAEVFDQELYDRNTVTVTYTINDSLNQATFANNETVYEYTEHDGSVEVKTPKVYEKDGKELNVVWTDTNNELKGEYTSSMTLTATVDRTAPKITIITDENAKPLYAGNTYTELGATATDNYDGDLTDNIIIDGSVDTRNAGTYYVTYTATDANGNSATATRTVTVNEPSTITYTISDSLNKATFADGIKTYTYTENDGTVSVNLPKVYDENGNELNVTWKDSNNELKGEYTYSTTLTATVDRTAPVITVKGDTTVNIFVNGTYTELGATATDNGKDVEVTTTGTVDTTKAGTYYVTYTATDANGNSATETRTVVVNEVKFEGIKVESVNAKYVRHQDFDLSTFKLIEVYNDERMNKEVEIIHWYKYWNTIVCITKDYSEVEIKGFDTGSSNVGNGRTASVEYNNLTTTYTYDVRFNTHLGQEYGKNYIEFDLPYGIPYGTDVSSITYYAADGSQTQINPYSSSINPFNYEFNTRTITYYITDTEYSLLHAMDGTKENGKMVVTFNNGTSYTYTVVESN